MTDDQLRQPSHGPEEWTPETGRGVTGNEPFSKESPDAGGEVGAGSDPDVGAETDAGATPETEVGASGAEGAGTDPEPVESEGGEA